MHIFCNFLGTEARNKLYKDCLLSCFVGVKMSKRVLAVLCFILLMPVALANHNGYSGNNNYGNDNYYNGFRGFTLNFDNFKRSGSGYEQTTSSGYRRGSATYQNTGSYNNNYYPYNPYYTGNGAYGDSVTTSYNDQYSDTVRKEYQYQDSGSNTYGTIYGGLNYGGNEYYSNNYNNDPYNGYYGIPYENYGSPYYYGNYHMDAYGSYGTQRLGLCRGGSYCYG